MINWFQLKYQLLLKIKSVWVFKFSFEIKIHFNWKIIQKFDMPGVKSFSKTLQSELNQAHVDCAACFHSAMFSPNFIWNVIGKSRVLILLIKKTNIVWFRTPSN